MEGKGVQKMVFCNIFKPVVKLYHILNKFVTRPNLTKVTKKFEESTKNGVTSVQFETVNSEYPEVNPQLELEVINNQDEVGSIQTPVLLVEKVDRGTQMDDLIVGLSGIKFTKRNPLKIFKENSYTQTLCVEKPVLKRQRPKSEERKFTEPKKINVKNKRFKKDDREFYHAYLCFTNNMKFGQKESGDNIGDFMKSDLSWRRDKSGFLPYKEAPFVFYQLCLIIDILMPYLAFLAMKESFCNDNLEQFRILTQINNYLYYARKGLMKTISYYLSNASEEVIRAKMNGIWYCMEKAKCCVSELQMPNYSDNKCKPEVTLEEKEKMHKFLTKACSVKSQLRGGLSSISQTDVKKPSAPVLKMFDVDFKLMCVRPKSK